ncbi:MAG: class II D-tagatose-bisphosphate aldolase, non-catalytic subunit [Spirochaetia bacterium]|jgi:D-tagatose-1,6-bisphosphate aldolase subunit GatZ/KbaZ
MECYDFLRRLAASRLQGAAEGIYAVCSSHPNVIEAALARARGARLLIETTSNQVNQSGGYTGLTPSMFAQWIAERASVHHVPPGNIVLGGDHIGPYPWRREPSARAMEKAKALAGDCVKAGYGKIHLDASMHAADDPGDRRHPLDPKVSAERAAEICEAAESAWRSVRAPGDDRAPLYVIGTDVPVPGGTESGAQAPKITSVEDLQKTIGLCGDSFRRKGLGDAWERVIAVVVQPGVEHGEEIIHRYRREKVAPLVSALGSLGSLSFEAHATDYQTPSALRTMVQDGFAILKVGPSLTGAVREALFLLTHVEEALSSLHPRMIPSRLPEALEAAMLADPAHWATYYHGEEKQLAFARMYGLSDRCRYYWGVPSVKSAVEHLLENLRGTPIPLSLLRQYFPRQYADIQDGTLETAPEAIIRAHIDRVLEIYAVAVTG